MSAKTLPASVSLTFRVVTILLGCLFVAMGWEAQSDGQLWTFGYNPRLGDWVVGTTMWWIFVGSLLIIAGVFPWGCFANRNKR
jgi:uncharacterized membrane protein YphA (DoxX/SURF4 family)